MRKYSVGVTIILLSLTCFQDHCVRGFTARLNAPWTQTRFYINHSTNDSLPITVSSTEHRNQNDHQHQRQRAGQHHKEIQATNSAEEALEANNTINKTFYKSSKITGITSDRQHDIPTIKSCFRPLVLMMRPGNIPGVILFHIIGIYRSLRVLYPEEHTWKLLLHTVRQPSIVGTLSALILIVSTSMIVNDYYDAKSGVDYLKAIKPKPSPFQNALKEDNTLKESIEDEISTSTTTAISTSIDSIDKPLATGEVPLFIAKIFLNILYAILSVNVSFLPGVITRLSAIAGTMLTYYYTQHLKPKTWLKNISCATLMALAPLISGFATLQFHAAASRMTSLIGAHSIREDALFIWRTFGCLFSALFCGFMGRELVMDITDCDADKNAGIITIPVRYGKRATTKIVFSFWAGTGFFTSIGPMKQMISQKFSLSTLRTMGLANMFKIPDVRRLILAMVGSIWLISRATQIFMTEGTDDILLRKAIEEAKINVLFVLASCI